MRKWPPNADGSYPAPETDEEFALFLQDREARLCSGFLYKILVKTPGEDGQTIKPFIPNQAQREFMEDMHYRSIILKSRQIGFSTLIAICWLDHALWNSHQRCGIIAQDLDTAGAIFRDKVVLAYRNLPEALREEMPLATDSASELVFAHNGSSLRVATSMRGLTLQRLHISELAKVSIKYRERADEIMFGSVPAVPETGVIVIESTAEGTEGHFADLVRKAQEIADTKSVLHERDWRLHFFAWHQDPNYTMNPKGVIITPADATYFMKVEAEAGITLTAGQKAWYCATRDGIFGNSPEKMWSEYPSLPSEPFQVSMEGCYYATQLAIARKDGRIGNVPILDGVPVFTAWDIGSSDGTAIWFGQKVGAEIRWIDFFCEWGEPYSFFAKILQSKGYLYDRHLLPHDATHRRQQGSRNATPQEMLEELLPGQRFDIVPRIPEIQQGIQMVRDKFSQFWFDEARCAQGLKYLAAYRKEWNSVSGGWKDRPLKDESSEACDALRMFCQGWEESSTRSGVVPRRRPSGWGV